MSKSVYKAFLLIGVFFLGIGQAYSQKDSNAIRQKEKENSEKEVQKARTEKADKVLNAGRERAEDAVKQGKEMRQEAKENRASGMEKSIENIREEYRPNEKYLYKFSGMSRKEVEAIENPEHRREARNIYIMERMRENEGRFMELKSQYKKANADLDLKLKSGEIDKEEYKKRQLSLDKALEHLKNAQEKMRKSEKMIKK